MKTNKEKKVNLIERQELLPIKRSDFFLMSLFIGICIFLSSAHITNVPYNKLILLFIAFCLWLLYRWTLTKKIRELTDYKKIIEVDIR